MDTIISAILSRKTSTLPPIPALERLPNKNESATVAYPPANSVAGSTHPFSTTEIISERSISPLTSPADVVDVDDCDALGPDNN